MQPQFVSLGFVFGSQVGVGSGVGVGVGVGAEPPQGLKS